MSGRAFLVLNVLAATVVVLDVAGVLKPVAVTLGLMWLLAMCVGMWIRRKGTMR